MIKGKRILVTGGTGFIGTNLVRKLMDYGADVYILTSSLTRRQNDFEKVSGKTTPLLVRGNLKVDGNINDLIRQVRPDGVFHLATSTIMSGVAAPYKELVETNVLGTHNLIDALADIDYKFFINVGSFTEYGFQKGPIKETDRCEPTDDYSATKLASTLYAQRVARTHGKPIVTFRVFTPFGPFIQKGRLVYNVLLNAMKGTPIRMTSPYVTRDFVYVDDLVDLFIEGAERAYAYRGEIFNAASGVKTTLQEVIQEALVVTESKSPVEWGVLPNVSYDSDIWQADMSKTFGSFKFWRPQTTFSSGMARTHSWLRENLHRYDETIQS